MESEKKNSHEDNPNLKQAREHFREAHKSMHKTWEKMLPEGLLEEHRKTRRELLLGFRSMIDFAIEKSEKHARES